MTENVRVRFAKPFLVLFDYLPREQKLILANSFPQLGEFTSFDNPLYRIMGFHGGRGGGKSWHFAEALLIMARIIKITVLCCREVQNTIKDSVHKLLKNLIIAHGYSDYQVTEEEIRNSITGSEFRFKGFSRNTIEIKSREDVDICWVEEAESIKDFSLKILQPTIRKKNSQIWFSFNRFKYNDPVWERYFKKPGKRIYLRKINWDENPFFCETEIYQDRLDDLQKVIDGEMTQDDYDWIWEGEPMGQHERALFKRREILDAIGRPFSNKGNISIPIGSGIKVVGIDPSGLGKDEMVWVMFEKYASIDRTKEKPETVNLYRELKNFEKKKTVHGDRIILTKDFINHDKSIQMNIDATNMEGFGENLIDEGFNVNQINFANRPRRKELYPNARNEMAFEFHSEMKKGHVSLLPCEQREKEMQAYLWERRKMGKYYMKCLEEKSVFIKREGFSPNYCDASFLAIYEPYSPGVPFVGVI